MSKNLRIDNVESRIQKIKTIQQIKKELAKFGIDSTEIDFVLNKYRDDILQLKNVISLYEKSLGSKTNRIQKITNQSVPTLLEILVSSEKPRSN